MITEVDKMVSTANKGAQMLDLYNRSTRFKDYVDRCCKADKRSVEDVLSLALVQEVGKSYLEAEAGNCTENAYSKGSSTYVPMGECV